MEAPVLFDAARGDLVESLRIRDDPRPVQRAADVVHVLLGIGRLVGQRAGCKTDGGFTLLARSGQCMGEHGSGDAGDGHPEVESDSDGPAPRTLLHGRVDDDVDERLARLGVDLLRTGDLLADNTAFLESDPVTNTMQAVQHKRYISLHGVELNPPIRMVDGVEKLADGLQMLRLSS